MRKIFFMVVFMLLMGVFTHSASAETGDTKTIGSVEIKILEDGRVAPIQDPQSLTEIELNTILREIGYAFTDIVNYDDDYKRKLVSYGGKVIEPDSFEVDYSYLSEGKEYSLDDYSKDEIREMQIKDLEDNNISDPSLVESLVVPEEDKGFSTFGTKDCGIGNGECKWQKFEGRIQTIKVGETRTQSQYIVQQNYDWVDEPAMQFSDLAGVHWGEKGEPEEGTAYGEGAATVKNNSKLSHYFSIPMDLSSNHGFTANIKYAFKAMYSLPVHHQGALMEVVNIDKAAGSRVTISGLYAHPIIPNNWNIGVTYSGVSVSGNIGTGDKFTWRHTFTVQ